MTVLSAAEAVRQRLLQNPVLIVSFTAVLSRILTIIWSVAVAYFGQRYDTARWTSAVAPEAKLSFAAERLHHLTNWDGHYFMSIASTGYRYEQHFAFFPGWPALLRLVCRIASAASQLRQSFGTSAATQPTLNFELDPSCATMSSTVINMRLFVVAAVLLYNLTSRVTRSQRLALAAGVLFALNPASIFFTAAYTESSFAVASFGAMLLLDMAGGSAGVGPMGLRQTLLSYLSLVAGAAVAVLAAGTRSNGVLLAAWVVYAGARLWQRLLASVHGSSGLVSRLLLTLLWPVHWAFVAACTGLVVLPLAMLQAHGWGLFCTPGADTSPYWLWFVRMSHQTMAVLLPVPVTAAGLADPLTADHAAVGLAGSLTGDRPWCRQRTLGPLLPFPPLYSFVQQEYWGVGMFQYWELKQLPQFALASPVLALAAWAVVQLWRSVTDSNRGTRPTKSIIGAILASGHARYISSLASTLVPPVVIRAGAGPGHQGRATLGVDDDTRLEAVLAMPQAMPYILHWTFLCVLGLVGMYVQVTVRVTAAACPQLYWAAAVLVLQGTQGLRTPQSGQKALGNEEKREESKPIPPSLRKRGRRGSAGRVEPTPGAGAGASGSKSVTGGREATGPAWLNPGTAWIAVCLVYGLLGTALFSLHYNWT